MDIYFRITHSLLTLYMILLILRWFGSALALELEMRVHGNLFRFSLIPSLNESGKSYPKWGPSISLPRWRFYWYG